MNLENARGSIGLEFQSLVQNLRSIKKTDPLIRAHPDIHYNLDELISRRNWLAHEYGTTAPVKWSEIADSVFNDVPRIGKAVVVALRAQGVPVPESEAEIETMGVPVPAPEAAEVPTPETVDVPASETTGTPVVEAPRNAEASVTEAATLSAPAIVGVVLDVVGAVRNEEVARVA